MHMKSNDVTAQTANDKISVYLWGNKQMGSTTQTLEYNA